MPQINPACFDPRDAAQKLDDPSTWKRTDNPALISAMLQMGTPEPIDWAAVALKANHCDEVIEAWITGPGLPSGVKELFKRPRAYR